MQNEGAITNIFHLNQWRRNSHKAREWILLEMRTRHGEQSVAGLPHVDWFDARKEGERLNIF